MKPDLWMDNFGNCFGDSKYLAEDKKRIPHYSAATIRKCFTPLLEDCKAAIEGGIETVGDHEPEWSKQDRILVARIAAKLQELEGK